jgi:hypothetical protein
MWTKLPTGDEVSVVVPFDTKAGDTFEFVEQVDMVHCPDAAKPGVDYVKFTSVLTGKTREERIPQNAVPGQYFEVGAQVLKAKASKPLEIHFIVPEGIVPGTICIEGPHGPFTVSMPEGADPGGSCVCRLGPSAGYTVTVPDSVAEGQGFPIILPSGKEVQMDLPSGKKPGDTLEFVAPVDMVLCPDLATPGADDVEFTSPSTGKTRQARVPENAVAGQYFEVAV